MKNRHLHRNNQHSSFNDASVEELGLMELRLKHNSTFVTQKTLAYEQEIFQYNGQIEQSLKTLNEKAAVAHRNQEEIFAAFKLHLTRVRMELEDFKKHNQAQASSSNSYLEKIDLLERQLAIFRDESLRLFSRVADKEKTIQHLRATLSELLSEKKHMDLVVKQLQKRNRELECQKESKRGGEENMNLEINSFSKGFNPKNKLIEKLGIDALRPISTSRIYKNSNQSKTIQLDSLQEFNEFDQLGALLKEKLPLLDEKTVSSIKQVVLQVISKDQKKRSPRVMTPATSAQRYENSQTRMTINTRSNQTVDFFQKYPPNNTKDALIRKSQQLSSDIQLCEYFKKCIDTVRKVIGVRRRARTISFYKNGTPISIDQFKKVDFIHLMELVCSHQSVIEALYNALIEAHK